MAPMIRMDTMELLDDCLDMMGVNFDEISSLATSEDCDYTKLMENNGVDVSEQPVRPQPQSQFVDQQDDFIPYNQPPSSEFVVLQATTPEPFLQQDPIPELCNIEVLPASTEPTLQSSYQEYLMHSDTHPASPEFVALQPANPESFLQPALSPDPCNIKVQPASPQSTSQLLHQDYLMPSDPQSASHELLALQPANPESLQQTLGPHPYIIKVQPANLQELDLLQVPISIEFMAPSPASSILSPLSLVQLEEEDADTPSPQQVADAPKKRGRKRKYPEGMAPSRRRPRKPKVYEMGPLPDDEMEKKRKNAVNAKRHRDMQKEQKQQLANDLAQAIAERDRLQQVVNQCRQREQHLLKLMRVHGIKSDVSCLLDTL